jgi:hypothetical protein
MGNYKKDKVDLDFYTKNSTKCKCGHTNFLGSRDKVICSWCNRYVFKNKRIEFMYRVGELIKKCNVE